MSNETFETKRNFITGELSRCIAASCPGVLRLEYRIVGDDGSEALSIRFVSGFVRMVDVTGKDLQETMAAVLADLSAEVA